MALLDPLFDKNVLLTHMDGANGSTTIIDQSDNNAVLTAINSAQISTTQSVFGGSSLYCDQTTSDYVTMPNSCWDFGTEDFSIEFRFNISGATGDPYIIGNKKNANYDTGLGIYLGGIGTWGAGVNLRVTAYWPNNLSMWNAVTAVTLNTWYTVQISRIGKSYKLFINGIYQNGYTDGTLRSYAGNGANNLMTNYDQTGFYTGYLDEIRITKGAVRNWDAYTIATDPFVDIGTAMIDYSELSDTSEGIRVVLDSNSESLLYSSDSLTDYIVNKILEDAVVAQDATVVRYTCNQAMIDRMQFILTTNTSATISNILSETINILDLVGILFNNTVSEGIVIIDTLIDLLSINKTMFEGIVLSDDTIIQSNIKEAITNSINILDLLLAGAYLDVSDGISVSEQEVIQSALNNTVNDSITLSELLANYVTLLNGLEDIFAHSDSISSSTILNQVVSDLIMFYTINKVDPEYISYLLSPETFSVSTYTNYNFNGSCIFKDNPIFINDTGLYEYGGVLDDTENIVANIQTSAFSFKTSNLKQVPNIYIGASNSNKLVLKVSVDGQADILYNLTKKTEGLQTQKIALGKGLIGRYFQFELITQDSTQFELESIEFLPITLKRKL